MKTTYALLMRPTFVAPALAAEYRVELKPEETKNQLTLADPLHTVHGTFHPKRGRIDFDPDIGNASGHVVVDLESGNSGLESARFPDAIFTPDRMERNLALAGAANVKVHETLSLHGAAHELTMEVHATPGADELRRAIEFENPYVAWGTKDSGNFLLKVSKTVKVSIEGAGSLQKQ
jgi:polyisoprenoid-binding protein YceI